MSPRARRIVIPLIVAAFALGIVLTALLSPRRAPSPQQAVAPPAEAPAEATIEQDQSEPDVPAAADLEEPALVDLPADGQLPVEATTLSNLRAAAPDEGVTDPDIPAASLGSLDPRQATMYIEFSRVGAGMARLTLADQWQTASAKRQADAHYAALNRGDANVPPLPDPSLRYKLKEQQPLQRVDVPVLGAHSVLVNGQFIDLFAMRDEAGDLIPIWAELAPGRFHTHIVNEDGQPILRITRQYELGDTGDITLTQRVENLTTEAIDVQWRQFGPSDLIVDRGRYIDRRRFRFGYLMSPQLDPNRRNVLSRDNDLVLERTDVFKRYDRDPNDYLLWPNATSAENEYELSWFATTNRYFALVVHPVLDAQGGGSRSIEHLIEEIRFQPSHRDSAMGVIFTYLYSPTVTIEPATAAVLDMGVYAGPMDRHTLSNAQPYAALNMNQLVLYQMSTFCAICTFQWLALLLINFLSLLHDYILFDWGLAIIGLVIVVRGLLHPITKRSQINMMRFGKQMQAMKPEIDRLQKKYKDEPKKIQQEQLRLMREHGINPFQMLGCLPMFLQFPIWVALYAMLYFAFDIRHQPAFFGLFQYLGGWPFLADLSIGDHFFGEFAQPIVLFGFWNITGINVLPILMGVVLFVHQKYMTPPPSATMTPEQMQQQKIMRVMLVGMMPIFLYTAPSGLTLYILTSSIIGIVESKYVRSHVDQMDLAPKAQPVAKKKKIKDRQGRAYAEALERAKAKRAERNQRTYKKKKGK